MMPVKIKGALCCLDEFAQEFGIWAHLHNLGPLRVIEIHAGIGLNLIAERQCLLGVGVGHLCHGDAHSVLLCNTTTNPMSAIQ